MEAVTVNSSSVGLLFYFFHVVFFPAYSKEPSLHYSSANYLLCLFLFSWRHKILNELTSEAFSLFVKGEVLPYWNIKLI